MRGRAPTRYAHSWCWKMRAATVPHPSNGSPSVFLQGIVAGEDLRVALAKMPGELLGYVHRAVLAAGAADRNGEIAAIRLGEIPYPPLQEPDQVRDHAAHAGVSREVLDHRRVAAVLLAQRVFPVGIRQAAHVEDEIGIARDAV